MTRNRRRLACGLLVVAAAWADSAPVASGTGPQPRIVGGSIVDAATVPWTVAILNSDVSDTYNAQFCGGSLIGESWVLTAAHCMTGELASNVAVVFGKTDLRDYTAADRHSIDRIVMQPHYKASTMIGDVALLHLTTPAIGATVITWNSDPLFPARGDALATYGWGNTSAAASVYPFSLHGVTVSEQSALDGTCGLYSTGQYLSEHMVCAGVPGGGKDSCQGDSGGPLVAYTPDPVLVGDTSWGAGCADADYPGLYGRVSSYADWITQTLDSSPPELSIGDVSALEGDVGTRTAKFTVTLNRKATSVITVAYASVAGTASSGSDYKAKSGTLSFAAGATSKTISITLNSDTSSESDEAFTVGLSSASGSGVVLSDAIGGGVIINDDASSNLNLGIGDVGVIEGDDSTTVLAQFTVSLNRRPTSVVSVNYSTAIGTASSRDFTPATGVLTFSTTATQKFISIKVAREWIPELNEAFTVSLSGATGSGVIVTRAVGTATIIADDPT